MQSIRIHVDTRGMEWAVARCRACANMQWYPAREVLAGPVTCGKCGQTLDLQGSWTAWRETKGPPQAY